MELSLTNHAASATFTASSQHATLTADNLASPQRPFLTWRTTATGAQNAVIDFGVGRVVVGFVIVNVNFTSLTIQGNASDSWGSPSFSSAVTITRNPLTGRYQYGGYLTGFAYRYMRLSIPSQATTDAASYYEAGGLWAGPVASLPRDYDWRVAERLIEPRVDVGPSHRGFSQRLTLGRARVAMTVPLSAKVNEAQPGNGDEYGAFLSLERQMRDSVHFVLFPELGDSSQIYVCKRMDVTEWSAVQPGLRDSSWDLEEAVST